MVRTKFAQSAFGSLVCACALLATSCVGTTGGEVIDFDAAAAGPSDAQGGALDFTTGIGWQVHLTSATLHVGAMYLVQTLSTSGAQPTDCILPSTYVAQVIDGMDVDLLSGAPQPFPTRAHGTTLLALAGQVWLTEGAVDAPDQASPAPVLALAGTASRGGDERPFTASITISAANRTPNASDSPFANPICKQRVVSPIPTSVQVEAQGGLLLRVDPRLLFVNVDFSALSLGADGSTYVFKDDSSDASDQPSINLYGNLRAVGAYTFLWSDAIE